MMSSMDEPVGSRSASQESWGLQQIRNEAKQNCIECDFAGRICSHYKPLSWGGSPFVRSGAKFGESHSDTASVGRAASEPDGIAILALT
jgi:hypothetical protein